MTSPTVLAISTETAARLESWAILAACLVIVIGTPIFVIKKRRQAMSDSYWDRLYQKAEARATRSGPPGPLVTIEFYTYSGILVWFQQSRHHLRLPANQALETLRLLHHYNLWHALIPYPGTLFVPLLSFLNLSTQRRSVRRQLADNPSARA